MNTCVECGQPCRDDKCPDCRYRGGGRVTDTEQHERDTVEVFLRHSRSHFRSGFTADQLQQVGRSER
jgi:hypothetical protein